MDGRTDHLWTYILIFVAEFSGTTFLLYFGCTGLMEEILPPHVLTNTLHAPLVWGGAITAVIMMFGHISRAHFNPAVTLCAIILRIITPLKSLAYFLAQMTGATFGYWLSTITLPKEKFPREYLTWVTDNKTEGFCNTVLHQRITPLQGLLIEFMGSSVLIYSVCSAWDPRNSIWSDSVALKFGLIIITIVIGIVPLTGSSLNPVRSFGPALINGVWENHWIYWVAPLGASLVTTLVYKYLYLPDATQWLRANEKLSDQFRQGSLYSKGEDTENLISNKSVTLSEMK